MKPPWTLERRFWPKVQKGPGCWLWTGSRLKSGYGRLMAPGPKHTMTTAHRMSWIIANGPIPDGLLVLHHCDNPPCVRPDHLFLGSNKDNMEDCASKGRRRNGWLAGEAHPRAKLTEAKVREIRFLRAHGLSLQAIATRYGMSDTMIRYIVTRKSWKHVA